MRVNAFCGGGSYRSWVPMFVDETELKDGE
jgi:hypothetical protein